MLSVNLKYACSKRASEMKHDPEFCNKEVSFNLGKSIFSGVVGRIGGFKCYKRDGRCKVGNYRLFSSFFFFFTVKRIELWGDFLRQK